MASEYDNIQLYSNYNDQVYTNGYSDAKCFKNRIIKNNKRKKIIHKNHYETTAMAIMRCHKPNKNSTTRNYRTTATKTTTSIVNNHNINYHNNNNNNNNNNNTDVINNNNNKNNNNYNNNNNNNLNNTNVATITGTGIDINYLNDNNYNNNNKYYRLPIKKSFSCYNKSNKCTLALLIIVGLLFKINLSCGFILDGTQNSYAQFRKWYTGLNGTLELEFKTEQPNGLVLYTDDGGTYDFFELKLVEGALRLRYNLGGGAQIITVGRDLHDGHWHKVQVSSYN